MRPRPPLSTLFPYTTLFRSQVTLSAYDQLGRLTLIGDPLHHSTQYQYDDLNRRTALIDGNNNPSFMFYNQVDKLTDRKSTRLNSSHRTISYAVFCLKKKKNN